MAVITFGDTAETTWLVAGWAFRELLLRVHDQVQDYEDVVHLIRDAVELDGLHFKLMNKEQIDVLAPLLLRTADEVIAGTRPVVVDGRRLDEESQNEFRHAVGELRQMLEGHVPALRKRNSNE